MRYTYKCDSCDTEIQAGHSMSEVGQVMVVCPECGCDMRIKVGSPSHIITSTVGNRGILSRDRPSNREYQAYIAWENAGGEPGTKEHKRYMEERGYD